MLSISQDTKESWKNLSQIFPKKIFCHVLKSHARTKFNRKAAESKRVKPAINGYS